MKILIIGGGNMGLTYAQSFLRSHITNKSKLSFLERSEERAAYLRSLDLGQVFSEPEDCLSQADLIILAVKPQDSAALFARIRQHAGGGSQLFLSIMAGVPIRSISEQLNAAKVVRAMPNLPAQVSEGMTVFTATNDVTRLELVMVQNLLSTTGKTLYVERESAIDASTAISGSGPAYVYYFMRAMMEAAQNMGFSQSEAELLVTQTFTGAVDLYNKTAFSCDEWIGRVASKGGTTEAALAAFEAADLHQKIMLGANAALDRAVELGKK
jgi:pyrroline-5-carboxylate reductase